MSGERSASGSLWSSCQANRGIDPSYCHGAAVAYAANTFGARSLIFMPENASTVKVDAVRGLGAEVRFYSNDSGQTEIYARAFADEQGLTFVSPYNDPAIIGGQGTIGKELIEQVGHIDEVFLSVGGGGLLSGIAGYLKGIGRSAFPRALPKPIMRCTHRSKPAKWLFSALSQQLLTDAPVAWRRMR
ncbi:pyridoxal-phosphate dependent enzyme (plasmid) [Rhizobium sp. 007]|nr:pyridoxal-phosphate dependent enzyme [Rhizobium sp. 007]